MFRKACLAASTAVLSLGSAQLADAGDPAPKIDVYRWDLTALDGEGLGGFAHALLVGPGGGTVVNTRLIVEFVTLDAWNASGLEIGLAGPIEQPDGTVGTSAEVSGDDFGWSGQGHFQVVYETDALNGEIIAPPGFPSSLWSMHLNDIGNPYFGHIRKLRIELDVADLMAEPFCPGDLNGDGEVMPDDLMHIRFGPCPAAGPCPGDVDGDGVVTPADVQEIISFFGTVCPVAP